MLVCAISDTHGHNLKTKWKIPECDMIIHAGDMTPHGSAESLALFARQMAELPARWKLCVFGNHDRLGAKDTKLATQILAKHGVIALTDELISIPYPRDRSITIYGLPWIQLNPGDYGKLNPAALNFSNLDIREKLQLIPGRDSDVYIDILISHQPPAGILDENKYGYNLGSSQLYYEVTHKVRPRVHVFGHIHESHGVTGGEMIKTPEGYDMITTKFINASLVDDDYKPVYEPIMFEV